MSLDQVLIVPGFRSSSSGGGGATFALTANNLVAGTPALGTPSLTFHAAYSAFLPSLTPSQIATFGLRKLNDAYAGSAITVREDGGDTETTIGFVNGELDVASLETFANGNNCYVKTWHDQSGNGQDWVQATPANQPQIVESGSVILMQHGKPGIRFLGLNKTGTVTLSPGVDTDKYDASMTLQVGSEPDRDTGKDQYIYKFGNDFQNGSLRSQNSGSLVFYFGNGSSSEQLSTTNDRNNCYAYLGAYPAVYSVRGERTDLSLLQNQYPIAIKAGTETAFSTETELHIGDNESKDADFLLSEFVLYERLSVADHEAVSKTMHDFHGFDGSDPADRNIGTDISQRFDFTVKLYDWLQARTASDFAMNRGSLTWDGTYADIDTLLAYYLFAYRDGGEFDVHWSLRVDDEWYTLQNGDNRGLEVLEGWRRHFETASGGGSAANLAAWYSLSIPNGGSEGNGFYQDPGLGRRAMCLAIWELLNFFNSMEESSYFHDKLQMGGPFQGAVYAFRQCNGLLDATTRQAFIDFCQWWIRWGLTQGPNGVNSNIDCKWLPGAAGIHEYLDAEHKSYNLQCAKRMLFGDRNGTPATTNAPGNDGTNDKDAGIYGPAGSIIEGGSYETTYNGRAFRHLGDAWAIVRDDPDWAFLGTVVEGLCNWYNYQTFPDTGGYEGPSDYAGRTGGSMWSDQDAANLSRQWVASDFTASYPLIRRKNAPVDASTMAANAATGFASKATDYSASDTFTGTAAAHTNDIDFTITWTPDTGTDELVITGTNPFSIDDRLMVYAASQQSSDLPGGLSATTEYWVVAVSGQRIQVSTTQGGAAVSITSTGTAGIDFRFYSYIYLTDSPDLSGHGTGSGEAYYVTIGSNTGYIRLVDDVAKILKVREAFNIASASPQNYIYSRGPTSYSAFSSWWISEYPHTPRDGKYTTVKALIDANDQSTLLPFERTGGHNVSLADDFWSYKTTGKTPNYGWWIQSVETAGRYAAWHGGTLGAFWTEDYGLAILGKHDKSGGNPIDDENTSNWDVIEQWAVTHLWGRDNFPGTPNTFSSARNKLNYSIRPTTSRTYDINGTPKSVEFSHRWGFGHLGTIDGMSASNITEGVAAAHTNGVASRTITLTDAPDLSTLDFATNAYYIVFDGDLTTGSLKLASADDGLDTVTLDLSEAEQTIASGSAKDYRINSYAIEGDWTWTQKWEERADGTGMKVTQTLTTDNVDWATELNSTIPFVLQRSGQGGTDAAIEYWTGTTWLPISTTPATCDWIRCRRTVDATEKFVWVNFSAQSEQVYISASGPYIQAYQGDAKILPVFVNLLGATPGTATQVAATRTLVWETTTVDPGLTPTDPVASITLPNAGDTMPVGRQFAVQADVTFYGTGGTVTLEYSTAGASGPWTSAGAMTNTTGSTWEFLGGTVPASLTHIRLVATDSLGTTDAGTEIAAVSATYTTVLDDPITGTNGTLLDGSYTGWTTNTSGNVYIQDGSGDPFPEILDGYAHAPLSDVYICGLDVGAFDGIVEADLWASSGPSSSQGTHAAEIAMRADGDSTKLDYTGIFIQLNRDTTEQLTIDEQVGSWAAQNEVIPGFTQDTWYRASLDLRKEVLVWQLRDPSDDSVIIQGARFDCKSSGNATSNYVRIKMGYKTGQGPNRVDNVKFLKAP